MKNVLKLGAVVLAIVMVLSMSVTAFASEYTTLPSGDGTTMTGIADSPDSENGGRASDAFNAVENTVRLSKSIVFINDDPTNVYEPNITYTYTISGVDVEDGQVTVTDEHTGTPTHTVVVNDTNALENYVSSTTATATFADGNAFVAATAEGVSVTKTFDFTFVPSAFPHAGIYRFLITESVAANARETAGVVSTSTYAASRYLDVYVRNGANGNEIYGYVLFEANSEEQDIDSSYSKSNGWVNTASSGDPAADVDTYTTYNAYVQKHVDGSLADKTNAFPFEITLANTASGVTRTTKIRVAATDAKATVGDGTTTWTGNTSTNPQESNAYIALNGTTNVVLGGTTKNTIKHGGEIGLYGIPADTTIQVEETNNTYDVYTASATVANGTTAAATKNIDYKAANTATEYTTNVASAALNRTGVAKMTSVESFTAKKVIDFTNTISEISPTGVVLRVAPYALMLGVGLFLVLFMRRRKNQAEA